MLNRLAVALCVVAAPFGASQPATVSSPSPITVAGGRSIELRDDRGTVTRVTTIPWLEQVASRNGRPVMIAAMFTANAMVWFTGVRP